MNDVNELWSSAWRQLQKNLASSFAAGGSNAGDLLLASPVQGRASSGNSWLVRARSAQRSASRVQ
ncbi:MAG TPA: hypothetical protein VN815_07815 [Steroidobacteraceae bacterium]|nr:hypothetical protein [Steroidobacteraceae bacterium]